MQKISHAGGWPPDVLDAGCKRKEGFREDIGYTVPSSHNAAESIKTEGRHQVHHLGQLEDAHKVMMRAFRIRRMITVR